MEKLINDLLGHSKLGRQSPVMGVLSLSDVIKSVCSDFEQQLKDINAQFIPEEEMPQIIGDETLLRQIFSNLIGNAITYRRIEMPLIIRISAGINAGNLIIKVTDNGIGILQEYWEKIFDVFLRLHHDDAYAGTGIGLATVKKAVTLLGGTVWVESVVGEGSTFFISIPQNSKPGNKLIN
jgi:light-regulated signal transduction histidine kinase (bacteriophytochrome)